MARPPITAKGEALFRIQLEAALDYIEALSAQRVVRVYMHVDAVDNLTLTNQPNASDFLGASSRIIQRADLANCTECRISARVRVSSASANDPRIYGVYANVFTIDILNYADLGADLPCEISLSTAGVIQSDWVELATEAREDGKHIAVFMAGGDGAADPSLGAVILEFR